VLKQRLAASVPADHRDSVGEFGDGDLSTFDEEPAAEHRSQSADCQSGRAGHGPAHGLDLDGGGNGTVVELRLYQLIRQPNPIVDRPFEIEFLDAGVEMFTFG
jgi:hypothetical protein